MKARVQCLLALAAVLAGATLACVAGAPAAPAKKAAAPVTNAVVEIPQSIFVMPFTSTTQEVRDPFFPNTSRIRAVTTSKTNAVAAPAMGGLVLKAIFGTTARPLATINSVTFGVGEEQDVLTSAGKIRVLCVEIRPKDEIVVVEAAGRRRELHFSRK